MKLLNHALVYCLLLACSSVLANPTDQAEGEAESAVESVEQSIGEQEAAAETLRHKDRAISVMDEPLDGTSLDVFTKGLDNVDQKASEQEYRVLMSALDFLLFYDIGAKRDKAKLYARLNGETPNEILDRVARYKGKKAK